MSDLIGTNKLTDQQIAVAKRDLQNNDPAKIKKASQKFEALFLTMLFSEMRKAMAPEGFFGTGSGSDIFQSMMEQNFGELIARREQFGIAKLLEKQLLPTSNQQRPDDKAVISKTELNDYIENAALETGLQPELIRAVIQQESGGDPNAVSPKGASGLMQLMHDTAQTLGVKEVFDPAENVMAGSRYLKMLLDRFGDLSLALAAYNAGPANVEKYGNNIPPFAETQNYVDQIIKKLNR